MKIIKNNEFTIKKIGDFVAHQTAREMPKIGDNYFSLNNIESSYCFAKEDVRVKKQINYNLTTCRKNNILYGKLRPYLDKCVIHENVEKSFCCSEIIVYETKFYKYFLNLFHHEDFINHNVRYSFGTKMPRTSSNILLDFDFKYISKKHLINVGNLLFEYNIYIKKIKRLLHIHNKIGINSKINDFLKVEQKRLFYLNECLMSGKYTVI